MSERPLDAELLSENAANVRAVGGHLVDIANDLDVASKELASLQNENQRLRAALAKVCLEHNYGESYEVAMDTLGWPATSDLWEMVNGEVSDDEQDELPPK